MQFNEQPLTSIHKQKAVDTVPVYTTGNQGMCNILCQADLKSKSCKLGRLDSSNKVWAIKDQRIDDKVITKS